ncbi:MAG: response regulator [Bdellovibrionales bacterium]|jgi:CheY-like chemotaxis protein/nitrogen-specific signal transduction histidine kinase/iron only hydrogenase large subunit-like protein
MAAVIILDEVKCVGCNKCIAECPVEGANVSYLKDGRSKVRTNQDACILCGRCVDVCDHGARDYRDDTEAFFRDLANGERISVIAAPSIRFNISNYKKLFGYLSQLGSNLIYDVSFGADICTWSYLRCAEQKHLDSFISQACPAIVSYIEKHCPELIDRLAPSHSPMLCTAIYLRKYKNITNRIAFLSPCIAKEQECIDTDGLISYNVTFKKIKAYLSKNNIALDMYPEKDFDDIGCGLGVAFSRPGGLRENVEYHTNNQAWIRQVEGVRPACDYLRRYAARVKTGEKLPFLIDILNCSHGCNLGTGTCKEINVDDIDAKTDQLKKEKLKEKEIDRSGKIIYSLFETFDKELSLQDFSRTYKNKLVSGKQREFTEREYDKMFNDLYKFDAESRRINCFACGYGNCKDFAKAVLSGDNHPGNCINYNRAVAKAEHQEVMQQKLKAEAATRAKSDFLANMSHEIRTPLNAVLGMTQLLLDTEMSQEQHTWAQIINQSGESLLGLINDILDLTKIEAEHLNLESVDFNLCSAVAEVTDTLSIKAREKGLEMIVSFVGEVPEYIKGDPGRFKQILYNLIGNATKFTQNGHILTRIVSEKVNNDIMLKIDVEDTGIGIPEEKLAYIFEKFAQGEESTTRRFGGTGLGLAISQKLIRLMGGEINVTSKEGLGSTFSYTIRMRPGSSENTIQEVPDVSLKNKRALIVDDYLFGCEITKGCLDGFGIRADIATTKKEALQKVLDALKAKDPYDFMILDYKLGEENGLTLCDDIAFAKGSALMPMIIMVTAYGYFSTLENLAAHGVMGFMVKPFYPAQMETTLKLILNGRLKNIPLPVVTRHTVCKILHDDLASENLETESFKGTKILVVEDMPFNQLLMTKILNKFGCNVDMASDGSQALQKVKKVDYDIVFMDCQMPVMDGYVATREIREIENKLNKHTPIIALTADAMTEDRERCFQAGMDDHLGKPFKQEQIVEMIKKYKPKDNSGNPA